MSPTETPDSAVAEKVRAQTDQRLERSQDTWAEHAQNPHNWSERKKWIIFMTAITASAIAGLNSTAIATPSEEIADALHVDYSTFPNDYWTIVAWGIGAGFTPLAGIPLLENFGIRTGYLASFALLPLFTFPQGLAKNFATLIVFRVLSGGMTGMALTVPEAMLADLWPTDVETTLPITIYIYFYMAGITTGPVFGAMAGNLGWRWVSYAQAIIFAAYFPVLCLTIKETRGPIIRARLIKEGRLPVSEALPSPPPPSAPSSPRGSEGSSRGDNSPVVSHASSTRTPSLAQPNPPLSARFYDAVVRPTQLLFTEPVVASFTLWSAFSYGLVFISTQSIPLVFRRLHDFSPAQCGLVQLSLFIGESLGVLACLPQNRYYLRSAVKNTENPGVPIPEARLPVSIPASLFGLAGGLFWYAWTSTPHVHWLLPAAGLVVIGIGIQVIVTVVIFYLTDAYGIYSASVLAALAFGENMISAFVPLAARRMYGDLGLQWASSTLGFIAIVLTLAPVVLRIWGRTIRNHSRFMREAAKAAADARSQVST